MPLEPMTQTIKAGKQHPFGDIRLVKLVTNLPFEFSGE